MLRQLAVGKTERLAILAGVAIMGLGFLYLLGRSFTAESINVPGTCLDSEDRFYSKGMQNIHQDLEKRLQSRYGKSGVVKRIDVLEKYQEPNSDFLTVEGSFVFDIPKHFDAKGTLTARVTKECNVVSLNLEY